MIIDPIIINLKMKNAPLECFFKQHK